MFITPNKYLSAPYASGFRSLVLQSAVLSEIVDLSRVPVFESASVYPVLTIIEKSASNAPVRCLRPQALDENSSDISSFSGNFVDRDMLSLLPEAIWGFLLSSDAELLKMIVSGAQQLQDVVKVGATTTAAEASDLGLKLQEMGASEEASFKVVNTGTIDPFTSLWGERELTDGGRKFLMPTIRATVVSDARRGLYAKSKLMFAKIGTGCECFLDLGGNYAGLNINCAFEPEGDLSLDYLLGFVHSSLFHFLYEQYFGSLRMSGGYLQFQAPQLRVIPFKSPEAATQKRVCELVATILGNPTGKPAAQAFLDMDNLILDSFNLPPEARHTIRTAAKIRARYFEGLENSPEWLFGESLKGLRSEIRLALLHDESLRIELKESLEAVDPNGFSNVPESHRAQKIAESQRNVVHSVLKTICAFLNTEGGTLLIGVRDDKSIAGIEPDLQMLGKKKGTDEFELKLQSLIRDRFASKPFGLVKILCVPMEDGKIVCRVSVEKDKFTEHYVDGKLYHREGNNTEELSGPALADWLKRRHGG